MGVIFNEFEAPAASATSVVAPGEVEAGTLILNCAWTMIKVNYDHLRTIAQIIREAKQYVTGPSLCTTMCVCV